MIYDASVYDRKLAFDGPSYRVLIMRFWPRGVRRETVDEWLRDAAPSPELVRAYKHAGLPWEEFSQRYVQELPPGVLDRLRDLEREHGSITLLCTERIPPEQHCHRKVLLDLLQKPRGGAGH
jgi:uncharacterized protein YeaO (DUF488 family)